MSLHSMISDIWCRFQGELFPELAEQLGPLSERHRKLVTVLDFAPPEAFISDPGGAPGRPRKDRVALARAFIAKAVWNLATTRDLIDRIHLDPALRRLCGWPSVRSVPGEATFSRAFAEFAQIGLPARMHEALVKLSFEGELIEHISRDSTAIEGREKPARKPEKPQAETRKRGRPRKGEERPKEPKRLDRQLEMGAEEMIGELPTVCDVGTKRNAKGHTVSWIGYKLHIDAADGGIPISCLLTSASLHDSQAAIPLAKLSGQRVSWCYELMDAAYDSLQIGWHSYLSGHVATPIRAATRPSRKRWPKKRRRNARSVFLSLSGGASRSARQWSA